MKVNRNKLVGEMKQKMKKIHVDVSSRLERSFGSKVEQMVEIHYQGKPMTFNYAGPIENISIDVLHTNKELEENEVEHFDPTKERMDQSTLFLKCLCGQRIKTIIPTDINVDNDNVLNVIPKTVYKDILEHHDGEGHKISLDHIETETQVVPEDKRIKNFNFERINYYRLFPKKTTEIRYVASYGQDILAEAPQAKYSETRAGQSAIGLQNMMFMFFVFGLMEVFTYFASTTSSQPNYFATHVDMTPWYILIATAVLLVSAMWRLHIRDISKTMVKVVHLQSAPFYISNRGVLPVIMTNSTLTLVWDYQGKMMKADDTYARDVYHSLQNWTDSQLGELYRAKMLGQVEQELMVINQEVRDIQKLDYDFRNDMTRNTTNIRTMIYAVIGTIFVYSFALMFLTMLGISI